MIRLNSRNQEDGMLERARPWKVETPAWDCKGHSVQA